MAIDLNGQYDESAEANNYEPIPAGDYQAQIVEAKKDNISRNNDYGECLVLVWQVMGGDYHNRLVHQRLNLWGQNMRNNDMVVKIANSQFTEIRKATGKETPRDTDELLFIPCMIRVAVSQDKNKEYDPRNEIRAVKPLNGGSSGVTGGGVATSPQGNAPSGGAAMPWGQPPAQSGAGAPMNEPPF